MMKPTPSEAGTELVRRIKVAREALKWIKTDIAFCAPELAAEHMHRIFNKADEALKEMGPDV